MKSTRLPTKATRFSRLASELVPPIFRRFRLGRAALDSTATNERTADYYADAVNEPATLTFDRQTREVAQARAQMEFLNDALFFGACQKIAALVAGAGPALKIDGPFSPFVAARYADATAKSQYLEKCFGRFADAIGLLEKIRLVAMETLYHGETFFRKIPSRATVEGFDYAAIRPERICDPPGLASDPLVNDGVRYDRPDDAATPVGYYVRRENLNPFLETIEWEFIPADEIVHTFHRALPQQRRGVPESQSALNLIRELKILRSLEIQAVKNAAKFSVILHTDNPTVLSAAYAEAGALKIPKAGESKALPDGAFVAPLGMAPTFGDAKHPTTGFDAFKRLLAGDVGAALGVGCGKINNDHSSYNFSSAKMDEQIDATIVRVRQKKIAADFLDVVFNDWLTEFAVLDPVADELLTLTGAPENVARRWLFPEPRSIDRKADAEADEIELRNGTITLEQIAARRGEDYDDLAAQRKRELENLAASLESSGLGLSTTGAISTVAPAELPPPTPEAEPEPVANLEQGTVPQ